jgi:hypothetical protein
MLELKHTRLATKQQPPLPSQNQNNHYNIKHHDSKTSPSTTTPSRKTPKQKPCREKTQTPPHKTPTATPITPATTTSPTKTHHHNTKNTYKTFQMWIYSYIEYLYI